MNSMHLSHIFKKGFTALMAVFFIWALASPGVMAQPKNGHKTLRERAMAYCRADFSPGSLKFKKCVRKYMEHGGVKLNGDDDGNDWMKGPFAAIAAISLIILTALGYYWGWLKVDRYGRPTDFFDD